MYNKEQKAEYYLKNREAVRKKQKENIRAKKKILEQKRKYFHYTNLQPLWAADNLKKGSKVYA